MNLTFSAFTDRIVWKLAWLKTIFVHFIHRLVNHQWHFACHNIYKDQGQVPLCVSGRQGPEHGRPNKKARGQDPESPALPAGQVDLDPRVICGGLWSQCLWVLAHSRGMLLWCSLTVRSLFWLRNMPVKIKLPAIKALPWSCWSFHAKLVWFYHFRFCCWVSIPSHSSEPINLIKCTLRRNSWLENKWPLLGL